MNQTVNVSMQEARSILSAFIEKRTMDWNAKYFPVRPEMGEEASKVQKILVESGAPESLYKLSEILVGADIYRPLPPLKFYRFSVVAYKEKEDVPEVALLMFTEKGKPNRGITLDGRSVKVPYDLSKLSTLTSDDVESFVNNIGPRDLMVLFERSFTIYEDSDESKALNKIVEILQS